MFRFLLLLSCFTSLRAAGQLPTDSLTSALEAQYAASNLQGFAVAMATKDSLLYIKGFGFADSGQRIPYTARTVQNIGSISKTLIGVSLMKLVEEGKISLDTPVNDLLPFRVVHPHFPNTPILIRHLATHTSGIADSKMYNDKAYYLEPSLSSFNGSPSRLLKRYLRRISGTAQMTPGDYLKAYLQPGGDLFLASNFSRTAPGSTYVYSNVGATLAAYLIEVVTGQSFDDFSAGLILRPLGMHASGWSYASVESSAHAILYLGDGAPLPRYGLSTYPDGGLRTSCWDLARYLQEMMKGYAGKSTLLDQESFREMMRSHASNGEKGAGIFWEISKGGSIGHSGADPGVLTYLLFNPEKGYGQVFMTNTDIHTSPKTLESFKTIWEILSAFQPE